MTNQFQNVKPKAVVKESWPENKILKGIPAFVSNIAKQPKKRDEMTSYFKTQFIAGDEKNTHKYIVHLAKEPAVMIQYGNSQVLHVEFKTDEEASFFYGLLRN